MKRFLLCFALVVASTTLLGQTFPAKPVTIVVPYPAGGSSDATTRAIAQKLSDLWGQPVLTDNRPGAATMIGTQYVAKAPADGHTVLFVTDSFAVNPALYSKVQYDPVKDFAPVTAIAHLNQVLVVNSAVPANTLKELVDYAKANPGKLNYGSYGAGSPPHLAIELLKHVTGANLVHIPYKGIAPLSTDLIAGTVQLSVYGVFTTLPHAKAGRIRPLAIDGDKRSPLLPQVPTFSEAGFPEMRAPAWWGFVVPAGTPPSVVAKLHRDVNAVIAEREFRDTRLIANGLDPIGNTPEAFAALIQDTAERWGRFIRESNLRVD
jgi:tripartite-type tricarboxylate transporter receptor subunit TctC